ncbi:MAG: redoxin domain-containing protein [Myxococcales bacterium]|nr:redoxin domain-containing protein [Myxococcales bacterium]
MVEIQDELRRRKVTIVGISRDSAEESKDFAAKIGIKFPLLADPEMVAATAYGVAGEEVAFPAVFVVRQAKSIAWSYVGERTSDRPASQMVLEAVEAVLAEDR